jgi:hypothetical protein
MGKSPVSVTRADCGNGKKKIVVREREYDMASWAGLKTIASVVIAVVGVVVAVLTAYYTAEASQNSTIAKNTEIIATQRQRMDSKDQSLNNTLKKFDEMLQVQRKVLDDNAKAIVRIDTRQEVLIEEVKDMKTKLHP